MSSRNRSKSRTYYSQAGDHYVDSKSKQLLFQEAQVCTMGRTILKNNEAFDANAADNLIEKHFKRRKSHGSMYCLVDRVRFQKSKSTGSRSYRSDLTYREINRFYEHKSRPDCFTLGIEDERTGRRSYESYKYSTAIRQISVSPTYYHDTSPRNGPVTVITVPHEHTRSYERTVRSPSPVYIRPVTRQSVRRSPSPEDVYVYRNSRPVSIERRYDTIEPSRPRSVTSYRTVSSPAVNDEVTYLKVDNQSGAQISPNGPIYMYVSRSRPADDLVSSPDVSSYQPTRRSIYYNR
ncbi:hypothetical protein MS3_00004297 [Schistosoma haematobium]|uniref:Trematode PH-like domain-containing protein n=1 Tax=Schistosoma haematobium TaxID=6185 RepID=A0A922LS76_SCHHA|nr:hypothetical protein MS3_00004297 [Schistosoma haematobium]KAH9592334.1 hypothetical protein MS3_00004297 [Schistosoma haematobium]CAH8676851.1 unnamed protein product [Schistosoma haematobium]CAH8680108.1 unnamed protein product [Schistosoma haematobium]